MVLTETDYTARIIEYPPNRTPHEMEQYIKMTSIHDYFIEPDQLYIFQEFLDRKIKIIVLSYDLMEYYSKKIRSMLIKIIMF